MNPPTNLSAQAAGYLAAEANVLAPASSPGKRLAIAAMLLRRLRADGTDFHQGFRLRLTDELLWSTPLDSSRS
ncbi:MAG: hypothetical protein WAW85_00470 [Gordonia sp. (in: high G+C Gram-positive bacteria)]|uniref:hypothetical protein n=1 Tax=Gordonia sp. (in: high G+C Gram-positive bacteria) TaxID=84139 RepID=UPI003BB5440C